MFIYLHTPYIQCSYTYIYNVHILIYTCTHERLSIFEEPVCLLSSYAGIHTYTQTNKHTYMCTHIYTYMNICIYLRTHAHTRTSQPSRIRRVCWALLQVYICIYTYLNAYKYKYTYMHTHVYEYINICIYLRTHAHTSTFQPSRC